MNLFVMMLMSATLPTPPELCRFAECPDMPERIEAALAEIGVTDAGAFDVTVDSSGAAELSAVMYSRAEADALARCAHATRNGLEIAPFAGGNVWLVTVPATLEGALVFAPPTSTGITPIFLELDGPEGESGAIAIPSIMRNCRKSK